MSNALDIEETDVALAGRLATEAGRRLVALREQLFAAGASTWDVKDAGDAIAQEYLAAELARTRPDVLLPASAPQISLSLSSRVSCCGGDRVGASGEGERDS